MLDFRYFSGRRILDLSRNTWLLSWNVRPTWAVFKASWRSVAPSVALVFGLFLSLQREVHIYYYFLTSFQSLTWKNVRKRLYFETLTFKSVNETFRYVRPDEIEAIEQHAVLSCCRVVVYFAVKKWFNFWVRVSEARQFKWKLLVMKSSSTVNYAVQGGSKVWVCGWNPKVWPFKWKLFSGTLFVVLFLLLYEVVLSVNHIFFIVF